MPTASQKNISCGAHYRKDRQWWCAHRARFYVLCFRLCTYLLHTVQNLVHVFNLLNCRFRFRVCRHHATSYVLLIHGRQICLRSRCRICGDKAKSKFKRRTAAGNFYVGATASTHEEWPVWPGEDGLHSGEQHVHGSLNAETSDDHAEAQAW